MKKLFNSLLFVLAVSNAQAEGILDNTVFGVSLINQDINLAVNVSGNTVNVSDSGTGFGIYLDKYYKRKYRFNSALSYVGYDSFDLAEFSVSADYLIPLNQKISFFAGLSAGAGMQKYSDVNMSDASFGLIYGAQIGGIAYINSDLMLEAGYRQKFSNIETKVTGVSGIDAELDEVSEFYLNFLLMF